MNKNHLERLLSSNCKAVDDYLLLMSYYPGYHKLMMTQYKPQIQKLLNELTYTTHVTDNDLVVRIDLNKIADVSNTYALGNMINHIVKEDLTRMLYDEYDKYLTKSKAPRWLKKPFNKFVDAKLYDITSIDIAAGAIKELKDKKAMNVVHNYKSIKILENMLTTYNIKTNPKPKFKLSFYINYQIQFKIPINMVPTVFVE